MAEAYGAHIAELQPLPQWQWSAEPQALALAVTLDLAEHDDGVPTGLRRRSCPRRREVRQVMLPFSRDAHRRGNRGQSLDGLPDLRQAGGISLQS
jgi:hypothetical protein